MAPLLKSVLSLKLTNIGLSDQLGQLNDNDSRSGFFTRVWDDRLQVHGGNPFEPLSRHYSRCRNLAVHPPYADLIASRYNSDVSHVANEIKAGKDSKTKEEILKDVITFVHTGHSDDTCKNDDDLIAQCLISIALRVLLMCNIGSIAGEVSSFPRTIQWEKTSISDLLHEAFPKTNTYAVSGRLERSFHARNLENIGSIKVLWTDNLLDHLRLRDPSHSGQPFRVEVFHHAQFLHHHEHLDIFPKGLIAETQRTLALLFPGHQKPVKSWFERKVSRNKDLDPTACLYEFLSYDLRTIQSFDYWRDRLTILKQTYDEAEPRTIIQWWNDGRKSERWATFWVAALILFLTVFFGVVQCVEGGIQAYKAYYPG